jgi:hypothetical protein
VKPPIVGAIRGPAKTVITKPTMLIIKAGGASMSLEMAPDRVNGQAPKNPAKKRQIKIDCRSLETAVAKENTVKPNMPNTNGIRRPLSSEKGAQTRGPIANPITYKETPRVPTSRDIPYMADRRGMIVEKILLVSVTTIVARLMSTKV